MSKVIGRNKVNLRNEMQKMIDETDYEVLIQRTSQKIRCDCFDEKYNEADGKCPKCIGTGWLFKFERHKAIRQDIISDSDGDIITTSMGQLVTGYTKLFFLHDTPVVMNDYIWEVAWKNNKPIKLLNLYHVKEVSEQRGWAGNIEFKVVIGKDENVDKDFKNMYIGKAWRDLSE